MAKKAYDNGIAAMKARDFPDAIRHFSEAINLAPTKGGIYSERSKAYACLGTTQRLSEDSVSNSLVNFYKALSDAKKAVELKPKSWKSYFQLGVAYRGIHSYGEAIKAFKQGLGIDPGNDRLKADLACVEDREQMWCKGPYSMGSEMWAKLALDPVIRTLYLGEPQFVNTLKVLQNNPTLLQTYLDGGDVGVKAVLRVLDNQRKPLALPAPEEILPEDGDLPKLYLAWQAQTKGLKALLDKRFADAVVHFSTAIDLTPTNPVLHSNRSLAYASLGNLQKRSARELILSLGTFYNALSDAKKTIDLKKDWWMGYFWLGLALAAMRSYAEAIAACRNGLEINPDNRSLKSLLSHAEAAQVHFESPPYFFGADMWTKLADNKLTMEYMQQPDFVNIMKAVQIYPALEESYKQDKRVVQALEVLKKNKRKHPGNGPCC